MRVGHFFAVASATLLSTANGQAVPTACPSIPAAKYQYQLAEGWSAVKVADGLRSPRDIIIDSAGSLLIVEAGLGITRHVVSSDGCITSKATLIANQQLNHGIYLSPDGKTLYASSASTVWSWPYDASAGTVGTTATTLVTGMWTRGHVTRTLAIPASRPDVLVVSHGSDGNLDMPTVDPAVARAVVKVFNLTAVPSGGYNYIKDGWLAGYGLRNEVGLAFDPNDMLWGVENSGDNFARTAVGTTSSYDIHIDNPAEELNYLGDVTKPNNDWYGYPTCFTVGDPSVIKDTAFALGDQFLLAPNTSFSDAACKEKSVGPRLSMQAHTAPLANKFDPKAENMYISMHGSWNRQPPTGYKVVAVPFKKNADGGYEPAPVAGTKYGYTDVFYPPNEGSCSQRSCARPVGLFFDKSGRLYMTSDTSGEVFLLGKSA